MRVFLLTLALIATAGCDLSQMKKRHAAGESMNGSSDHQAGFPVAGDYDVVETNLLSNERRESQTYLDVANPARFAEQFLKGDGSHCRDEHKELGNGSFSFTATCDAPDGDIHNIGGEVRGNFTEDSIDISSTTILWGSPIRTETAYRLRKS